MECTILGWSQFKSKDGSKSYLLISFAWEDSQWKGMKAESKFVDPSLVQGIKLSPGLVVNVFVDFSGRITGIHAGT